jgi:hypothetical protein
MSKEKYAFIFVGLFLFVLGFDVLMIVQYCKNLSSPALIAAASIVAGTILAAMSAWFCVREQRNDKGEHLERPLARKISAFCGKVLLICVGGLSSTAIITLYFHQKAEAREQQARNQENAAKTDADILKLNAQKQAAIEHQQLEIKRINALKDAAADLMRQTGSASAARALVEKNTPGEGTATAAIAPIPTPTPPTATSAAIAQAEAQQKAEQKGTFKQWLLEHADSGIYYAPTIANLTVFIGLSLVLMFVPVSGWKVAGTKKQPITLALSPAVATAQTGQSPIS